MMNMTPLIDVVFLNIIFFLMTINFSDILARNVTLPKADEAKPVKEEPVKKISLTIISENQIFLGREKVSINNIGETIRLHVFNPQQNIVQLRGDESIPYSTIQNVMEKIASSGITHIEFAAMNEPVPPLEKDLRDEAPH
jgi:biopolymer transport protein ExbD